MEELIALANKLGAVSFATLLFLVLAGHYFKIWSWHRDKEEVEKRLLGELDKLDKRREAEVAKAEEREQWWRNAASIAIGIGETQSQVLRVKENREKTR